MSLSAEPNQIKKRDREAWLDLVLPVGLFALFFILSTFNQRKIRNPSEWVDESKMLMREKNFSEALPYTLKLVESFPKNHIYLDQAATLYFFLGNRIEEAKMLERFFLVAPDPSEACPRLPESYYAVADTTSMLSAAEKCLNLDPTNSDFNLEMALSYERAKQPEKALSLFENGKNKYPNYIDFAIGYARVLMHNGNYEQAWKEIEPIIQRRAELSDAQIVAGICATQLGYFDKARAILESAIQLHPKNMEFYSAIISLEEKQNHHSETLKWIEQALQIEPENVDFLKLKANFK